MANMYFYHVEHITWKLTKQVSHFSIFLHLVMNFIKLAQIKTFPKNIKGHKTLFHAP
jgi:hypothetical protein